MEGMRLNLLIPHESAVVSAVVPRQTVLDSSFVLRTRLSALHWRTAGTDAALAARRDVDVDLREIGIIRITPAAATAFLRFLKSGELALTDETACQLLAIARFLLVLELEEYCAARLGARVPTLLVPEQLQLIGFVDQFRPTAGSALGDLLDSLAGSVLRSFAAIDVRSPEFLCLRADLLLDLLQSDRLRADEATVHAAATAWVSADEAARAPELERLLGAVRRPSLVAAQLAPSLSVEDEPSPRPRFCNVVFTRGSAELELTASGSTVSVRSAAEPADYTALCAAAPLHGPGRHYAEFVLLRCNDEDRRPSAVLGLASLSFDPQGQTAGFDAHGRFRRTGRGASATSEGWGYRAFRGGLVHNGQHHAW